NLLADTLMLPALLDTLTKAGGSAGGIGIIAGVGLLLVLVVAIFAWATGVIVRGVPAHTRFPAAVAALALAGVMFTPYGAWTAAPFVRDQVRTVTEDLREAQTFKAELLQDPFHDVPADSLLARLKGMDVLLIFVESYGRASLDNPAYAPRLRGVLREFDTVLREKGFSARSSWVTSSTFGGESYLAHSTAVSGLWIDNRQRYAQLLTSTRRTLIGDFNAAGWRTVAVMPAITAPWPEAAFFRYGKIYAAPDMDYKGDKFDYLPMSDQFALSVLQTQELALTDRAPVMAEVALISSHVPWAPLPKLIPWDEVGDGSIFKTARTAESANDVFRAGRVPEQYAMSVDYSLRTLMSFITTFARDNTLLIILGDHQPMPFLAGENASHDVPAHIIAKDPALLAALDEDTWTPGMEPNASSVVWPMDSLRERILGAFTPSGDQSDLPPPDAEPDRKTETP
ncbi:MAG: hypothetical protein K2P94_17110, partial [Rhodospirillaceae bacterium]|nr:hypothetical protein [Rhodospirillaceae bacterium]